MHVPMFPVNLLLCFFELHLSFADDEAFAMHPRSMDLEPQKGNPPLAASDALLYASWAAAVAPVLHTAGLRFTADVADWGP